MKLPEVNFRNLYMCTQAIFLQGGSLQAQGILGSELHVLELPDSQDALSLFGEIKLKSESLAIEFQLKHVGDEKPTAYARANFTGTNGKFGLFVVRFVNITFEKLGNYKLYYKLVGTKEWISTDFEIDVVNLPEAEKRKMKILTSPEFRMRLSKTMEEKTKEIFEEMMRENQEENLPNLEN